MGGYISYTHISSLIISDSCIHLMKDQGGHPTFLGCGDWTGWCSWEEGCRRWWLSYINIILFIYMGDSSVSTLQHVYTINKHIIKNTQTATLKVLQTLGRTRHILEHARHRFIIH